MSNIKLFRRLIEAGVDKVAIKERYFARANFRDVDFRDVDFRDVDFTGADFTGADFTGADFTRADFRRADFRRADFRRVNLSRANLDKINLSGANFSETLFEELDLGKGRTLEKVHVFSGLYKYPVFCTFVGGVPVLRMGCFARTLASWEADFWNNPREFRGEGEASKQRLFAFEVAKMWFAQNKPS